MQTHRTIAFIHLAKTCEFFRDLPEMVIREIAEYVSPRRMTRGQCIFLKGDPGDGLYAICVGRVKVTSVSEDGKEIILNTFGPGDIFGEISLLDGGERSANAVSLEDGALNFLSRHDFVRVVTRHPETIASLLKIMADRVRRTTEQLEDRAFSNVETRLARALLKAIDPSLPARPCHVRATQQQLGEMIGLSREGTNRLLRTWERAGVVKITPGCVAILSTSTLQRIADLDRV